jgi:hypothetical protein
VLTSSIIRTIMEVVPLKRMVSFHQTTRCSIPEDIFILPAKRT